jgi:hypothetical protein
MKVVIATLSLLVLASLTAPIIVVVTGALAPEVFTAEQIDPAKNPGAGCERELMLGAWACRHDLGQRRRTGN